MTKRICLVFASFLLILGMGCTQNDMSSSVLEHSEVTKRTEQSDHTEHLEHSESSECSESLGTQTSTLSNPAIENANEYKIVAALLDEYFAEFIGLYSTDAMNNNNEKITIKEIELPYQSTEGASFLVYTTADGKIVRVSETINGETGNRTTNFYICENNKIFISVMTTYYSSFHLTPTYNDRLYYILEEYFIDGEKAFLIDRVSETLIKTDLDRDMFDSVLNYLKDN